MLNTAPNFSGNYPMAGDRLAPAWQAMWDLMGDGRTHSLVDLAALAAARSDLVFDTVKKLLRNARKAGLVEVEYPDPRPGHQRAHYRRVDR